MSIKEMEAELEATRQKIAEQLSLVGKSIQSIDPTLYDMERILEQAVIDGYLDEPAKDYMHAKSCLDAALQDQLEAQEQVNQLLTKGYWENDKIIKVRQYSTVICDIDGTIADLTHRLHFIKNADGTKKKYKEADWDSFHKTCTDDLPITRNIMALESLAGSEEREVYFFSGRNEEVREETIAWICKHVNINTPMTDVPNRALWTENPRSVGLRLFMRKKNDRRADTIVKLEMMQELGLKPRDVLVILDDRQCVVDMWRDNKFNCHQVNAWKEQ